MTINKDSAQHKNALPSNNTAKSTTAKKPGNDVSPEQKKKGSPLNTRKGIAKGKIGKKPVEVRKRSGIEKYNAYLASFPEMNSNPILELDIAGNLKYQNPACKLLFPDLINLGLNHPFLVNLVKVIKDVQTGNVVQPTIHETSVGSLVYELTCFIVNENQIRIYGKDITDRKKAEHALQASEENYRNFMENSSLGIRIVSEDGETLYSNKAFLNIYGYKNLEEFKNTQVNDRYTPESYVEFRQRRDKRRYRQPLPDNYEISIVRKDGKVRHLQVIRKEILWDGKPQYQTIYQDVTERKLAEEALKDSEEKYRALFENAAEGIVVVQNGLVRLINRRLMEMTGYSFEETIARPFVDFIHPEERALAIEQYRQKLRDNAIQPIYPLRVINKAGQILWFQVNGSQITWENKPAMLNMFTDITKQKRLEEALKESEEKYRLIVEKSSDVIFTFNAAGEFIYVSPSVKNVLGYNPADLVGHPFESLIHPDDLKGLQQAIQRNIKDGSQTPGGNEYRVRDASGEWHWHNTSGDAAFDANGKFLHFVAIARDTTEHKLMTSRIIELNKILQLLRIINQDIVKIDGESELLKKACNQFIENRNYQLAWIGFVQDGSYDILPTAWAGEGSSYLSSARFRWDDSPLGNGPTGTAIKTGKFCIVKDIFDPKFEPWREQALKRGFKLVVALPLTIRHKVMGVLNISSTFAEAFNEVELDLLVELAGDLSLGIEKIRRREDQLRTERALKASEQNFHNTLDSSSMGIHIVDMDMHLKYVNQAFLDIFGYDNIDELKASPPEKHYTPESYAGYLRRKEQYLRGESAPDTHEVDIIRKDGAIRHLQISSREILWDGKQHRQFLHNDITELTQIGEALKASEQNFRNSMDSSSMGIRIMDDANCSLYANQTLLDIFKYKNMEELIASPPQEHYTPESYAGFIRRKEQFARGESFPNQTEFDIVREDGAIRHLQLSTNDVLWNGKLRHQIIYHDITERQQAEEALRESEEKYRLIIENTRDLIFTLNAAGEYVYISPSVQTMFGYNPAALIGKSFLSLVHPEDMHIIEEETARSSVPGYHASGDIEYRIRHTSGEWRWVISRGNRTVDPSGKFLYFIGVIRDISAHKRAEKEKQILEEKAQINSRLAAVGEMAAGIAHEINNPLTGVIGFSQLLLEKENVPEDIRENLKLIADSSQRVADIVKRLLTFARQTKPVKTMSNLNELIENTLKLRDYVLKTANIHVVTRFDPELPWSLVDPGQIQQVFLNLIVNAEQAMKAAHGKGNLTITTEKKKNSICMSFQDDGPGVTKENLGHLFEPFFTTKALGEGTGLGLSLSRSIILEHGGTIDVESESGHGATFIIVLPIIESLPFEADVLPPPAKVKPAATKKGKILVIDDEPGVRALLEKVLIQSGHSVDTISDATKALDKIGAGLTYDVILTDVRMPGMSGIELYSRILEKMPEMKNRIIFITGDVMGVDIKAFLTQNNLPYLAKPFDTKILKEQVASIVDTNKI